MNNMISHYINDILVLLSFLRSFSFVCPLGDKKLYIMGGHEYFKVKFGDKHFMLEAVVAMLILMLKDGCERTIFVVSEESILVIKASKLSTGYIIS